MSNNDPMAQGQLDAIKARADSVTTLRRARGLPALRLSEDAGTLIAEVERLRALLTVDRGTVERAAREAYGPQAWDRLLEAGHGVAAVQLSAHRAMTRAILETALTPPEEE